jgi:hypothetical protein
MKASEVYAVEQSIGAIREYLKPEFPLSIQVFDFKKYRSVVIYSGVELGKGKNLRAATRQAVNALIKANGDLSKL